MRVRLIHWNGPEGRERKQQLASLGHDVEFDDLDRLDQRRALRVNPPDAYVIDLSRLPSQGREVAMALRTYKDTRNVPMVFVEGEPEKVQKVKALLPDATFTTWGRLKTSLSKAVSRRVTNPVVPPSSIYSGKPTVEKLGVKPGMRVCVLGAPPGFLGTLGRLPAKASFTAKASADCDLFLVVVRSQHELAAQFVAVARHVDRETVWVIWPKKGSGVRSDVNANVVRAIGLAAGWVDFKVCSVSDVFSGYAFKRRRSS
jgi:CheY-like chemotaxis protein